MEKFKYTNCLNVSGEIHFPDLILCKVLCLLDFMGINELFESWQQARICNVRVSEKVPKVHICEVFGRG